MNESMDKKPATKVDPSNWTCVDGLGRVLSAPGEVRAQQKDRFVVLFYWPCHGYWPQIR